MAASNTPFPCFKTTGDDKHDIDIYTEDLRDYCVMQNWYDSSKETEAQTKFNLDKVLRFVIKLKGRPSRFKFL